MRNMRSGIPKLFKDGYKQFTGVEEAILNNVEAVKQFAEILRTSFGPNGMNKIVINHIEKVYVTSDCATIVEQLRVEHPAANVVVQAAAMQEKEIGDGSNFVVIFSGELLKKAEDMIGIGLHPSDIVSGYDKAIKKCLQYLETLQVDVNLGVNSVEELAQACKTSVASKAFGMEDFISNKVAEACMISMPENPLEFLVDNVRTVKILGSNVLNTEVVNGMVLQFRSKTNTRRKENSNVLVMNTNVGLREMDVSQNVLFENADDLLNFSRSEETVVEASVQRFANMGVGLLILSNKPTDLETHYLNKYAIYTLIVISKFARRRLCRMLGARQCVSKDISPEDLGRISLAEEIEIGGRRVTRLVQAPGDSCVSTIVIRGASENIMSDIERACFDGVNTIRAMCRNSAFVAGAGATEVELSKLIQDYGATATGLDQYAIKAFGEALEVVPRTLAHNSGMDFEDTIAKLYAAHSDGNALCGVDIVNKDTHQNVVELGIYDLLVTKKFALRLATNAVLTILRVDHIIMSKPAGGPKKPNRQGHWDDDDEAW